MEISRPVRAAVAAVVAWLAVLPMGGLADDYSFYAPLGAVIAVTATVIGSVRESVQTIAGMAVGVLLAAAATPLPQVVGLLLVVGLGTAVAVVPLFDRLGAGASWAPVTGMFVLVIGGDSPWEYATAYLGLTTFGALVGLFVNLLWPPLPLNAEDAAIRRVRLGLADQLEDVSDGLARDLPPTRDEWVEHVRSLGPLVDRMRETAARAADARLANWRARRRRVAVARYEETRAYERLAFLVEDLTDLVQDQEHAERERVALGPRLRPYAARALADLAAVLRERDEERMVEVLRRAETSVEALVRAMRGLRLVTGDDLLTAGAVVTAVSRTLTSLTPEEGD